MGSNSTKPSSLPPLESTRIPFLHVFECQSSSGELLSSNSIRQDRRHRKVISDVHLKSKRDGIYEVEFRPRRLKPQDEIPHEDGETGLKNNTRIFQRQGGRDHEGLNDFAPYLTKLIETIPTEDLRSAELTWYDDRTGLIAELEWWNLNPRTKSKSSWKGTIKPFSALDNTVNLTPGDISIPYDIGNLDLDDPQEMIEFSQRSHRHQLDADRSLLFNSRLTSKNARGTETQGYEFGIKQESPIGLIFWVSIRERNYLGDII
ncbi:uncharacterized protein L199_000577 [Kwoniella botswanensis]|uniref:uncharacterized protein n=1 Tax=Kwoniella botswanensis TaxID=1268659 RepID=UPI00315CDDA0